MRTTFLTLIAFSFLGCRSADAPDAPDAQEERVLLDDMESLAVAMITLAGKLDCPVVYSWKTDVNCSLRGFSNNLLHNVDGALGEWDVSWDLSDTHVHGTTLTGTPSLSTDSVVQDLVLEGDVRVNGSLPYTVDMVMYAHDLVYGDYTVSGIVNGVEFDFELITKRTGEDIDDCRGTDLSVDCD